MAEKFSFEVPQTEGTSIPPSDRRGISLLDAILMGRPNHARGAIYHIQRV